MMDSVMGCDGAMSWLAMSVGVLLLLLLILGSMALAKYLFFSKQREGPTP